MTIRNSKSHEFATRCHLEKHLLTYCSRKLTRHVPLVFRSGGIFHTLKSYGVQPAIFPTFDDFQAQVAVDPCQVPHVFGVQGGFSGLSEDANWVELTHDLVQEIGTRRDLMGHGIGTLIKQLSDQSKSL